MDDEEKEKVKVSDKRKFDAKGNRRESEAAEEAKEAAGPPSDAPVDEQGTEPAETPQQASDEAIEIDFTTFILSLGTQAMICLGMIPDPISKEAKVHPENARQLIDIISMLREKTQGNLDASEIALVDNLLFDLRMKYVEQSKEE